jgi:hypothetical protein
MQLRAIRSCNWSITEQMGADDRMDNFECFFKEITDLTFNHEVRENTPVVHPSALGKALSRVDPD